MHEYEMPKNMIACFDNTSEPPITLWNQGSSLKCMPPARSVVSVSHGEIPGINIYLNLSSMMPLATQLGLEALQAGEGTSTEDKMQVSLRPGQNHDETRSNDFLPLLTS